MDEIDAIGGRRFSEGTSADREIQRTLMEVCVRVKSRAAWNVCIRLGVGRSSPRTCLCRYCVGLCTFADGGELCCVPNGESHLVGAARARP